MIWIICADSNYSFVSIAKAFIWYYYIHVSCHSMSLDTWHEWYVWIPVLCKIYDGDPKFPNFMATNSRFSKRLITWIIIFRHGKKGSKIKAKKLRDEVPRWVREKFLTQIRKIVSSTALKLSIHGRVKIDFLTETCVVNVKLCGVKFTWSSLVGRMMRMDWIGENYRMRLRSVKRKCLDNFRILLWSLFEFFKC